jgi:2-amino-4-hydroxy-6-hydroxymethyldihydropteridine diphosphokinase
MIDALLSLGGNIGDRKATMDAAVERLAGLPDTRVTARSSYYRTEPDGPIVQDWFLNIAVALATAFSAADLATACRRIEADLGRNRSAEVPWGPRPIDIDLVATGANGTMRSAGGHFDRRAFVLIPLAEIVPATLVDGQSIADHATTADAGGVEKLDWQLPDRG